MRKRTRISDVALRVILSIALVVSFVPIVPSSSFAEEPDSVIAASADDSASYYENTAGKKTLMCRNLLLQQIKAAQGGVVSEGNSAGEGNSATASGACWR